MVLSSCYIYLSRLTHPVSHLLSINKKNLSFRLFLEDKQMISRLLIDSTVLARVAFPPAFIVSGRQLVLSPTYCSSVFLVFSLFPLNKIHYFVGQM